MDWRGVGYCDVFISCLDSHSDGTHSLRIKTFLAHFIFGRTLRVQLLWWPLCTITCSVCGEWPLFPSSVLVFVWEWVDLLVLTVAQKQIWTYRSVVLCCQVYVVASSLSSTWDLFICLSLPPAVFLFTRYFGSPLLVTSFSWPFVPALSMWTQMAKTLKQTYSHRYTLSRCLWTQSMGESCLTERTKVSHLKITAWYTYCIQRLGHNCGGIYLLMLLCCTVKDLI